MGSEAMELRVARFRSRSLFSNLVLPMSIGSAVGALAGGYLATWVPDRCVADHLGDHSSRVGFQADVEACELMAWSSDLYPTNPASIPPIVTATSSPMATVAANASRAVSLVRHVRIRLPISVVISNSGN